jgi:hypothetical protein
MVVEVQRGHLPELRQTEENLWGLCAGKTQGHEGVSTMRRCWGRIEDAAVTYRQENLAGGGAQSPPLGEARGRGDAGQSRQQGVGERVA